MTDKIKVLFLAANPLDSVRLQLDKEAREINKRLEVAQHGDSFDFIQRWAVRPDDLQDALLKTSPHIVHFSGHGSENEEILLQDDFGNSRPVNRDTLAKLLETLKDNIRIVVLNACYSKPQAEAVVRTIDFTIGMSKAIGDEAAITFAASFYRALGFGRSVHDAFQLGIIALQLEGIGEDRTPKLLIRDGVDASNAYLIKQSPGPVPLKAEEEPSTEMTPSELHEYITEKLTRQEIATLWWRLFGENMENEGPNRSTSQCVIDLLERVEKRSQSPKLRKELTKILDP
jgi:hypothetical protein